MEKKKIVNIEKMIGVCDDCIARSEEVKSIDFDLEVKECDCDNYHKEVSELIGDYVFTFINKEEFYTELENIRNKYKHKGGE